MPDALDILGRLGTELAKQLPDLTDDTDLTLPEVRGRVLVEHIQKQTVVQVEHQINSGNREVAGHVLLHYIDILREGVGLELTEVAGLVEELQGEAQALIMSAGQADPPPAASDPVAILDAYLAAGKHETKARTTALKDAAAGLSSSRPLIGDRRLQLIQRLDDVFSVPVSDSPSVEELLKLFDARRDCYTPLGLLEIK